MQGGGESPKIAVFWGFPAAVPLVDTVEQWCYNI